MRQRARMLMSVAIAMALVAGIGAGGDAGATTAAPGPNGLIAYSSWDENLNYDIYVVDPATPDAPPVRLTTDGRYNGNPDWSPDGTRLVFDGWSDVLGPRIQVMDIDPATDDWTVLSAPCADDLDCYGDFQPQWSPDGTRIAFVSSRPNADGSPNWSYEIYVMDATGEVGSLPPATRLTTDPLPDSGQGINDSQVTWSPDGQRMAFVSEGRGANADSCDLWMMDSHDVDGDGFGDNLTRLTFDESFFCDSFADMTPQWSPNSSLVAFASHRTGDYDIWLVNADDPTDLRNVTMTSGVDEDQPGWSPDGTQIIFRSAASGAYELYSLPVPPPASTLAVAARATPTQLTSDGRTKADPDWGVRPGSGPGTAALKVSRTGRGTVRSRPAGILCGRDCAQTFVARTTVTLVARPATGYRFTGWGGACTGTSTTCTLTLRRSRTVTASFAPA
jgi:uncharacterized repeat protein (TIGR02543 family)